MSHGGSSGQVSCGGTNSQIRYKKALKQINKLIFVNTSLKKQAQSLNDKYTRMQNQYKQLIIKYQQIVNNTSTACTPFFLNKSFQFPQHVQSLLTKFGSNSQTTHKKPMQHPQYKILSQSQSKKSPLKKFIKKQQQNLQHIKNLQIKIHQLEHLINQQNFTIQQFSIELKNKQNQQKLLKEQNLQLNSLISKYKNNEDNYHVKIGIQEELNNQKKKVEGLEKKLKTSENLVKKLLSDCQQFQKKLLFYEKSQPKPQMSYSLLVPPEQPNYLTRIPSGDSLHRQPSQQFTKLFRQYTQKKNKYKSQIQQLRLQNQGLNEQIGRLNNFIAKQQNYIESFMVEQPRGVLLTR